MTDTLVEEVEIDPAEFFDAEEFGYRRRDLFVCFCQSLRPNAVVVASTCMFAGGQEASGAFSGGLLVTIAEPVCFVATIDRPGG